MAFLQERRGNYQEALEDHEKTAQALQDFLDNFGKIVGKFYRVMFERQRANHLERVKYLKTMQKMGWKGVIVPPSGLSAEDELKLVEGKGRPLSLVSFDQLNQNRTLRFLLSLQ